MPLPLPMPCYVALLHVSPVVRRLALIHWWPTARFSVLTAEHPRHGLPMPTAPRGPRKHPSCQSIQEYRYTSVRRCTLSPRTADVLLDARLDEFRPHPTIRSSGVQFPSIPLSPLCPSRARPRLVRGLQCIPKTESACFRVAQQGIPIRLYDVEVCRHQYRRRRRCHAMGWVDVQSLSSHIRFPIIVLNIQNLPRPFPLSFADNLGGESSSVLPDAGAVGDVATRATRLKRVLGASVSSSDSRELSCTIAGVLGFDPFDGFGFRAPSGPFPLS
jgi:hypothetical protein